MISEDDQGARADRPRDRKRPGGAGPRFGPPAIRRPEGAKNGKGGGLSEADFNLFLRGAGKAKAPLYDLNGDARRDYIDDYIFTANYIVASERGKKVTAKEPK